MIRIYFWSAAAVGSTRAVRVGPGRFFSAWAWFVPCPGTRWRRQGTGVRGVFVRRWGDPSDAPRPAYPASTEPAQEGASLPFLFTFLSLCYSRRENWWCLRIGFKPSRCSASPPWPSKAHNWPHCGSFRTIQVKCILKTFAGAGSESSQLQSRTFGQKGIGWLSSPPARCTSHPVRIQGTGLNITRLWTWVDVGVIFCLVFEAFNIDTDSLGRGIYLFLLCCKAWVPCASGYA